MSSLSNLPYGKILEYWQNKLINDPYRYKFLVTKFLEVLTFKSHSHAIKIDDDYCEFQEPVLNTIPENPRISIVIPTYIRSDKDVQDISNLCESIQNQVLKPFEVIVIDDCSPIKITLPETIKVIRLDANSGPAKARNIGKRIALEYGSDIIAFTDTDCILSRHWLSTISQSLPYFKEYHILSGNTPAYDDNWFGTYHNINGTLNGRKIKNTEKLLYGTTANLAISRDVATNIDFNESFPNAAGEDIEFCFRANKQGYSIKHVPTMTVYHNYGYHGQLFNDLKRFRLQFKKYGDGESILLREIPNYYAYFERTEEIPAKL